MKRIPPDIDALMWSVAEGGDLAAIDDFERRFPDFRGELGSRLAMVRGLKQSKPAVEEQRALPRFVLKEALPQVNRRPVWALVALGSLAVLAFASFLIVANVPNKSPTTPKVQREQPRNLDPRVVQPESNDTVGKNGDDPEALDPIRDGTKPTPAPAVEMPWDKRQTVAIQEAPLLDVLKLIGQTCKLEIELAPNMPNPTVTVSYPNRTGMEMLKELGRQYGFTPLDQGKGRVLIVPAMEFTSP